MQYICSRQQMFDNSLHILFWIECRTVNSDPLHHFLQYLSLSQYVAPPFGAVFQCDWSSFTHKEANCGDGVNVLQAEWDY